MNEISLGYILLVFIIILVSMTIHEAMHAFTSYWLGDDTAKLQGRLTLNPIKHIDPFMTLLLPILLAISGSPILFGGAKPVPFNPNKVRFNEGGIALVAAAGPLSNLLIAFLAVGIWALTGFSQQSLVAEIFITTVRVNLGFFIFNMIPIPPLDGSRLLYVLAPDFVRKIMDSIEKFGIIIVFMIALFASSAFSLLMYNGVYFFFNLFVSFFNLLR